MRLLAALLALALALGACNTGFEPQYRVTDLRVLAVRSRAAGSASADVRLGDTLALDALLANPLGRAGLAVTWYGCVPATDERLPPCEDSEFLSRPERLAQAAAEPPETRAVELLGACQPAGPDADTCAIAVPLPQPARVQAALDRWLADPAFVCRPYVELPVVAVVRAEGAGTLALKTVRIVPSDADLLRRGLQVENVLNMNPDVFNVLRAPAAPGSCDGGTRLDDPAGFPAGRTALCALATPAAQDFTTCGLGGPETRRETYEFQWYATGGEFPDEGGVGNATGGEIDFVRPAGPFRLWTIVRDGRGGGGWRRYDLAAAR